MLLGLSRGLRRGMTDGTGRDHRPDLVGIAVSLVAIAILVLIGIAGISFLGVGASEPCSEQITTVPEAAGKSLAPCQLVEWIGWTYVALIVVSGALAAGAIARGRVLLAFVGLFFMIVVLILLTQAAFANVQ